MSDIIHSNQCIRNQYLLDTVDPIDFCKCNYTTESMNEKNQNIVSIQTRVRWEHSAGDSPEKCSYKLMRVVNGKWLPLTPVVGQKR